MIQKHLIKFQNLTRFLVLIFTILTFNNLQAKFQYADLNQISSWAKDSIDLMRENEIMTGFSDGTFRPKEDINRAQAVVLLQRIKKINAEDTIGQNIFPDVPNNSWYTKAVIKATQEGWIKGYPDGNFYPDKPVNRAELAMIILRAFELESKNLDNLKFKDVTADKWYAEPISVMLNLDLVRYANAPNYFPRKNVTRQDVAWIFAKILAKPTLTSEKVDYSNRQTIRRVAIKPRDFNVNKQSIKTAKNEMLIIAIPKTQTIELNLSNKNWVNIGELEVFNNLKQKANLDTIEFRLRFEKNGVGPADNFEVKISAEKLEKIARISKKGGVLFSGLNQQISEDKSTKITVFIKPITNVSYYQKSGLGHLDINKIESTMFGDLKSANIINSHRSAPVGYKNRRLTNFNFSPINF
jgi:hypothetical protein